MKKILIVLSLFILQSCGKDIPSATDNDVKNLVLEICTDELKNQLTTNAILSELRMSPRLLGNPSYLDMKAKDDESAQKVVNKVDEQIANTNLDLAAIRTTSVDENVGKIQCSAELRFNNQNKIDIEYTAQYTEDGQLYVEVYGLQ